MTRKKIFHKRGGGLGKGTRVPQGRPESRPRSVHSQQSYASGLETSGALFARQIGLPVPTSSPSPLHIPSTRGIRNYVESSVWLAGQVCATLVAVRHLSIKPVKSGN